LKSLKNKKRQRPGRPPKEEGDLEMRYEKNEKVKENRAIFRFFKGKAKSLY